MRTIRQWGVISPSSETHSHSLAFLFFSFFSTRVFLSLFFFTPDVEFMSCESFSRVNDLNRVQSPVLWQTRHLVAFIFLTWVFKRAAGRAEGCKAAPIWGSQVCDSMSCRAEQSSKPSDSRGLSYNPVAAQTSCVSLQSLFGHRSSSSCKRFGLNRALILSPERHRNTTKVKPEYCVFPFVLCCHMSQTFRYDSKSQSLTCSKLMGRVSHLPWTPQRGHILV